jgi:hypothetical protein
MAQVGFWETMVRDLTGRGMFGGKHQIRLVLQPLVALALGMRIGVRDAKHGRDPYFKMLVQSHGHRLQILKLGLRDAIIPLCLAFVVDAILQYLILNYVRPMASVVVAAVLVFGPFAIGRGLGNRIWQARHHRQIPHAP